MSNEWTRQRDARSRLATGAVGGALGGLAFLPVMLLLQPTLWARLVLELAPRLADTPAEFGGWLVHMAVLTTWGALFALVLPQREAMPVLVGAMGWAFVLAWFSAIAITLVQAIAIPPIGWTLETLAHAVYGAVLGGTLLYLARHGSDEEVTP